MDSKMGKYESTGGRTRCGDGDGGGGGRDAAEKHPGQPAATKLQKGRKGPLVAEGSAALTPSARPSGCRTVRGSCLFPGAQPWWPRWSPTQAVTSGGEESSHLAEHCTATCGLPPRKSGDLGKEVNRAASLSSLMARPLSCGAFSEHLGGHRIPTLSVLDGASIHRPTDLSPALQCCPFYILITGRTGHCRLRVHARHARGHVSFLEKQITSCRVSVSALGGDLSHSRAHLRGSRAAGDHLRLVSAGGHAAPSVNHEILLPNQRVGVGVGVG